MHSTTFRVRYAETDAMGVAHHASYVIWFELGRSDLLWQRGSNYADLEAQGYHLPVTELGVKYVAPARFGEIITVRTEVEAIRSRTIVFRYEVIKEETKEILATGYTKHICVDKASRVRVIPEWVRELL